MKQGISSTPFLARHLSPEIVNTKSQVGRMGDTIGMGISSIAIASISSVQESRVCLSITLAIVSKAIAIGSIGSNSLGGGIKSLSDWVKTSTGGEWDTVSSVRVASIGSVQESRVGISITLTLASTWDRDVSSIDTGSTLHTQTIAKGIGIASIA